MLGLLTLTIQHTMSATHTWTGVNYANAFNLAMTLIGAACLLLGTIIITTTQRLNKIDYSPIVSGSRPTA